MMLLADVSAELNPAPSPAPLFPPRPRTARRPRARLARVRCSGPRGYPSPAGRSAATGLPRSRCTAAGGAAQRGRRRAADGRLYPAGTRGAGRPSAGSAARRGPGGTGQRGLPPAHPACSVLPQAAFPEVRR